MSQGYIESGIFGSPAINQVYRKKTCSLRKAPFRVSFILVIRERTELSVMGYEHDERGALPCASVGRKSEA